MPRKSKVRLEWVRRGEDHVHVSAFAGLSPPDRPRVYCPVCGDRVTMRLSKSGKPRHHAAHRKGGDCVVSSCSETALHLNCKLHLAEVLRGMTKLDITKACQDAQVGPRLHATASFVAFENWDEVAVECAIGSRRPDILLLRGGEAVGAVEVHVYNAVSDEKAEDLKALGVPWVEVRAEVELFGGDSPWLGGPLHVENASIAVNYLCPPCEEMARRLQRERELARLSDEFNASLEDTAREAGLRAREDGVLVRRLRLLDIYWASGKRYRETFSMVEVRSGGACIRTELRTGEGKTLCTESGHPNRESWLRLRDGYLRHESFLRGLDAAQAIDSPMDWVDPQDALRGLGDLDEPPREMVARACAEQQVDGEAPTQEAMVQALSLYWRRAFPERYFWHYTSGNWLLKREHRRTRWDVADPLRDAGVQYRGRGENHRLAQPNGHQAVNAFLRRVFGVR